MDDAGGPQPEIGPSVSEVLFRLHALLYILKHLSMISQICWCLQYFRGIKNRKRTAIRMP